MDSARRVVAATATVAALLGAPAAAQAGSSVASGVARTAVPGRDYRPGEVVVRSADGDQRVVRVKGSVPAAIARLDDRRSVETATPNWIARTSFIPNDPGDTATPGGWTALQWNFLDGAGGVNAPGAWDNLIAHGRPGGRGVVVAVLDTGVAYRNTGRFRRSPDLAKRLTTGYDFIDNDRHPLDHNGHGTHVASTIAEAVDNGIGLTGLAYGATVMPVRVLDRFGEGDSAAISQGIRYAAKNGARIINLSFEFSSAVRAGMIPDILSALRFARRRGALVVGASGNAAETAVAYPARASQVLSVGAVTERGCRADYSNGGSHLDVTAPGGGADADLPDDPNCRPWDRPGRDIVQMTFDGSVRRFGLPKGYMGTSMAAPHVSATAALVIASRVIGARPGPGALERHLKRTADDLGEPGTDPHYGAGKVNAWRATLG